jgi:hypothetical protein
MSARVSRSLGSLVLLGLIASLGLYARKGRAAPLSGGLVVAEKTACRVLVTKVSYDDPGADDAEFIELRVERTGPTSGMRDEGAPDSSAPSSPVADASGSPSLDAASSTRLLTLGDCGLESLELVNGGAGACEIYRTLPLSSVPVPADDYVTFCATDSTLAPAGCDVMVAGRSALRNGWLQNGPSDGLRFRAAGGTTGVELAYEGRIACFQADARELVDETGQASGSAGASNAPDDVNTFCGDVAVLLPLTDAPLRHEAECPSPSAVIPGALPHTEDGSVLAPDGSDAPGPEDDASLSTTERASGARPKGSTSIHAALGLDAGLVAIPKKPSASPPDPPGCSMAERGPAGRGPSPSPLALVAVTWFRRRARTPRRPLRAQATEATSGGSDA